MKTVMKKIFSLMLVAVLLVSAVPFAASADTAFHVKFVVKDTDGNTLASHADLPEVSDGLSVEDYLYHHYDPAWAEDYEIAKIKVNGTEVGTSYTTSTADIVDGFIKLGVYLDPIASEPEPTCSICKSTSHTDSAHCSECGEVTCKCCDVCDKYPCECPEVCPECGENEDDCKCCDVCDKYPCECPEVCDVCGEETCVCVTVTFVDDKTALNTTDTYEAGDKIPMVTPEWVSGYDFLGWTIDGSTLVEFPYEIPASKAGKSIIFTAKYKKTSSTAKYPLQVFARLYTGDVLTDVVPIHRNPEMLSTDKIMGYLGNPNTKTLLENIISEKYGEYTWNGNFYNARGSHAATNNITTVDGAKSVYINLKTEADRVLVYVHTQTSTEKYDRLIELDGYKEDGRKSTVTKTEVKNALKKYYGSDISIKMFDKKGFKDYLNRKDNTHTDYVRVHGDVTEVHVRLYQSSSSSSSSAKPDSSNPKTGDMIFAPAAVLGLSASALAVMFYLNKKRVF